MADERKPKRPGFMQTLRQGWRPAGAGTKASAAETIEEPKSSESKTTEAKPTETKPAETKKASAKSTKTKKPPAPNMQERMEGLQGWMAEIERKQSRMTYFGTAMSVIAVAAAGAAIYFAVTAKNDSATKDDVDALKAELDGIKQQVTKSTQGQASVTESIDGLKTQINALTTKQTQDAADIAALKARPAAGAGTTVPPTTTTPAPGKTP